MAGVGISRYVKQGKYMENCGNVPTEGTFGRRQGPLSYYYYYLLYTRYNELGVFVEGFMGPPKPKSQGRA